MRWLGVHLACFLLKLPLNMAQRTRLVGAMLASNNAVPLKDVIEHLPDGSLVINGRLVDYDVAAQLREGARAALDNQTLKLVDEQVAVVAGKRGVQEGDTPEKLYFYRAALWWGGYSRELLEKLAQK